MNWDLVSYVIRSRYRRKVLETLERGPKTPTGIASKTGIRATHISRTLKELESKELVKEITKVYRGKIFQMTSAGEDVLDLLNKHEL